MKTEIKRDQTSKAATRLAEILIPEGIDRRGKPTRLKTAYGEKTRAGVADMIDRHTYGYELIAATRALLEVPEVKKAAANWATDELLAVRSAIVLAENPP